MKLTANLDSIESSHLRRLSKINLVYFIVPFLSALYDYLYLSATELVGGFIIFMLAFVLIYNLKSYNPKMRLLTMIWLVLALMTVVFISIENLSGNVEEVGQIRATVVGVAGLVVGLYYAYGIYTLAFDSNTKSLFVKG